MTAVSMFTGCAERDPTASKVRVSLPEYGSGDLVKTIAILPFTNRSNLSDETVINDWYRPFVDGLKTACADSRVLAPDNEHYPELLRTVDIDANGHVNSSQVADIGRALGLHTVITGTLYPVRTDATQKGLWIFRDTHYLARVHANVTAYSVETAAKRMDETFSIDVEIDDVTFDLEGENDSAAIDAAPRLLEDIVESAVDATCDMISDAPWIGFVIDNTTERIIISAGSEAGLRPGQVLDIYGIHDPIRSADGTLMRIPGMKIGELEVVSVRQEHSEAVPLADHTPPPVGASVRLPP